MAGGLATRLGELARDQPKSMIRICGKPFLEYQLEVLERVGVTDVILCLGHLWEQIEAYFGDGKRHGVNIRYSIEDRPLGTAGALRQAGELLDDPFFTMYGDSYLFLDFRSAMGFFKSQNRMAAMTVYRNSDRYDRSNTAVEGNLVKSYGKDERTEDMVYIDYGANIFRKEVLRMIPENRFYSLEDLFTRLIGTGELLAYEVKERFYEIGSPQGLKEFTEHMRVAA